MYIKSIIIIKACGLATKIQYIAKSSYYND